jgi:hypothetical protein
LVEDVTGTKKERAQSFLKKRPAYSRRVCINRQEKDEKLRNDTYQSDAGIASVVWWSEFLATDTEVWVRFLAIPDFLSSGSAMRST